MSAGFRVVIPARYASTRLPGKPLADLGGRPMIVRVVEQVARSGADHVVVATDDQRVAAAVSAAGHEARITRSDHPSGSDRVMEVVDAAGWAPHDVVVNVQGDEPLIPPEVIGQAAGLLLDSPDVGVATLSEPIDDVAEIFDPAVVKVVTGADGFARYFSRAPIPYAREAFPGLTATGASGSVPRGEGWYRHVGVYAYRVAALRQFVSLPVSRLESIEALEQLRLVESGIGIKVGIARARVPSGVDTEADLERVRRVLSRGD